MTLQGGATLRRASHVDAPRVALARATSFGTRAAQPGLAESASAILAEHLALGDFACWVVEIDDEIVSFGVGMVHQRLPAEHNPSGRWGYIQSMETHPAYRRRGYATAILRALQDWCRGLGLPSASLLASRYTDSTDSPKSASVRRSSGSLMMASARDRMKGRDLGCTAPSR